MATITANISASATIIPPSEVLEPGYYTLDNEAIQVTNSGLGNSDPAFRRSLYASVDRAVGGTTAATHSSGATLTRYYPDAAAAAAGAPEAHATSHQDGGADELDLTGLPGAGGLDVLGDPGEVWEPDTAVTEGYRIKHTAGGADHIFEAEAAGTTVDWALTFDELEPVYSPSGLTDGDNIPWRHIGEVGRLPDSVLTLGYAIRVDAAGKVSVVHSSAPDASDDLFNLMATVNGTPVSVFESQTDGDADWNLDENTGAGFRFNVAVDGVGVNPIKAIQMTTDGFKVFNAAGAGVFEVNYDQGGNFAIRVDGLPTADPGAGFPGVLWIDVAAGRVLKVAEG